MSHRILHPETINAMIPLIQHVADDLDDAFYKAARILRMAEHPTLAAAIDESLGRVQDLVNELEKLGGTVRSYEPVRVDFLSEVEGEIGYVCWQTGDTEGMHFHSAMERCEGLVLTA